MTNPIMSAEQFEALVEMFDAGDYAEWVAARDQARRLLVEPEQAEIHDGPFVGGPLDGGSMAMAADVVKSLGGEYEWGSDLKEWYWIPDDPADPDITTFGSIPRGQRCQALDDDPGLAGKVLRRVYDSFLRHGRNAVEEETGKLWSIGDDEPVRRLAQ